MSRTWIVSLVLASALVAPHAAAAPRGTATLAAQGGLGLPFGDFGEVADPGPGGSLSLDYWFLDDVAMGIDVGLHAWDASDEVEDALSFLLSQIAGETVRADVRHRAFQYTPHVRGVSPWGFARSAPWAQFGAGVYILSTTVRFAPSRYSAVNGTSTGIAYFGANIGVGVDFTLSPRARLGGGGTFHWIACEDYLGADVTQIALSARLSIDFGR